MCQCRPLSLASRTAVNARALQQAAGLHTVAAVAAASAQHGAKSSALSQPQQQHAASMHTAAISLPLVHQTIASSEQRHMAVQAPNVAFSAEAAREMGANFASPLSASVSPKQAPLKPFVPRTVSLNDDTEEDAIEEAAPGKKLSKIQMFKRLLREYGKTFALCYGTAWVTNFALIYGVMGLTHFDGVALLHSSGIDNMLHLDLHTIPPEAVSGLVAMEITEQLDIVRLPLLFKATPVLANWWKNRQLLKQAAEEQHNAA